MVATSEKTQSIEFSEKEQLILDDMVKEVFTQYDKDLANEAKGVTKEGIELGKLHVLSVYKNAMEFANFVGLNHENTFLLAEATLMHDFKKYSAERSDSIERLLLHAHDSEIRAGEYLDKIGTSVEDTKIIKNAILRHQPMPYVANALIEILIDKKEDPKWEPLRKLIADEAPDVIETGKFLGPNDEVSAVLYAADLMAVGQLANTEGDDPKEGAFDKIVEINVSLGVSLEDAVRSAFTSLAANVAVLKSSAEAVRVMRHETEYFQGRVPEILTGIADNYGQKLLDRAKAYIATIEQLTKEGDIPENLTPQEAMKIYYDNAVKVTKEFEERS